MNSESFSRYQPVAYQTIANSILHNRLSHAYLFHAPIGVRMNEYAEFFAQSLLCENKKNGLACGVCNNCLKVKNGLYADIITLSRSEKLISKEDVINVINQFNKTALERNGLKFYFIYQVENASPQALNSLLKFLEEPANQQTYAILTTNQIDRVLPTIISRCVVVPFKNHSYQEIVEDLGFQGFDEVKQYLLANLTKSSDRTIELMEDIVFTRALETFRSYLELLDKDYHGAYLILHSEGLINKKEDKSFLGYWLDLNIQFFKDLNQDNQNADNWYKKLLSQYSDYQSKSAKLRQLFLEAKDQLMRSPNLLLVVDRLFWQLKEII